MAKNKKFNVEVVFSTSILVPVYAEDADEAMDKAEYKASEIFEKQLNNGLYGASDFDCEAQTP